MELFDYLTNAGYNPENHVDGVILRNITTAEMAALAKGLNFRGQYYVRLLDNLVFLIVEA